MGPRHRLKGGSTSGTPRVGCTYMRGTQMSKAPITNNAVGEQDSQERAPCVISGVLPLDSSKARLYTDVHCETVAGPLGFHSLGPVINRQGPGVRCEHLLAASLPGHRCVHPLYRCSRRVPGKHNRTRHLVTGSCQTNKVQRVWGMNKRRGRAP